MIIFLVGTPRSGTTLIQSEIAKVIGAYTGPETHYYSLRNSKNFLTKKYWRKNQAAYNTLKNYSKSSSVSLNSSKINPWFHELEVQYKNVIEKTPRHLHYLSHIYRDFPDCRVFAIVREPYYVCRSMYFASNEHPKAWSGRRSIRDCVNRWIADTRIIINESERLKVICYEDTLCDEFDWLALLGSDVELGTHKFEASDIINPEEHWKSNNLKAKGTVTDYSDFISKDEFYSIYGVELISLWETVKSFKCTKQ
ncbi:sulfotransferase [Pseudoalteromonas sp. HF66]|uniref:sulfotransferase family protein n=1 Tax=Pseudoalteromonas sp. HF66 TaxID=2721559 RepID=UPI00143155FC|nr:sulfotransferase [Pseudoalteromonas sp. HF66]